MTVVQMDICNKNIRLATGQIQILMTNNGVVFVFLQKNTYRVNKKLISYFLYLFFSILNYLLTKT